MASKRTDKVNELIRIQLATLITREIEFPKETVIAVTRVITLGDLKKATVYVSVFPDIRTSICLRMLRKQQPHIQHVLDQHLKMYAVPRLRFTIENESGENLAAEESEIDRLFKQIQAE